MTSNKPIDQRRLEILAEPTAGGRRIGAPATEDEVRLMARELLALRGTIRERLTELGVSSSYPPKPDPGGLY
jgi:hypothetical protein